MGIFDFWKPAPATPTIADVVGTMTDEEKAAMRAALAEQPAPQTTQQAPQSTPNPAPSPATGQTEGKQGQGQENANPAPETQTYTKEQLDAAVAQAKADALKVPEPAQSPAAPPNGTTGPTGGGLMDRLEGGQMDANAIRTAMNDGSLTKAWQQRYGGS